MRIVQVNLAYDPSLVDPRALVDRYPTLTGLSDALVAAGASVSVVQRFSSRHTVKVGGVTYEFLPDGGPSMPAPSGTSDEIVDAVRLRDADVIHVNGLMFPAMVKRLRTTMPGAVIVVQDHAGAAPPTRLDRLRDPGWRGLTEADAWSFTAAAHATPWRDAGLLDRARVLEIVEASTPIAPIPRDEARALTAIAGNPAILWVGRLDDNKDPETVLAGLDLAFAQLPDARCWMVYGEAAREAAVREQIARSARLRDRVTLVGRVPHAHMARYYSAADVYVSGSRREGSGYALIEAMTCGLIPVVTDIPSFRAIAGDCGMRWQTGDAASCADALLKVGRFDRAAACARVRERFALELSWNAIGRRTVAAYAALVDERTRSAS